MYFVLCPLITEKIMKNVSIFKTASSQPITLCTSVGYSSMTHLWVILVTCPLHHLHIIRYMGELGGGFEVVRLTELFLLRQYFIFGISDLTDDRCFTQPDAVNVFGFSF